MSHVTHTQLHAPGHAAPSRALWIAALLALVAVTAVTLVVALGGSSSQDAAPVSVQAQPSLRTDGGPEESGVARAVGSRPAPGQDESRVAAAIAGR